MIRAGKGSTVSFLFSPFFSYLFFLYLVGYIYTLVFTATAPRGLEFDMRHDSMLFGFIAHEGYDQHLWRWALAFGFLGGQSRGVCLCFCPYCLYRCTWRRYIFVFLCRYTTIRMSLLFHIHNNLTISRPPVKTNYTRIFSSLSEK